MVVTNSRRNAEKALGITLVGVTALSTMGAGAAPALAVKAQGGSIATQLAETPTIDLEDGVKVVGPSIPFKDDATGDYWYKDAGKYTLNIDRENINGVIVWVNGVEVINEVLGVNGPNSFTRDITLTENSRVDVQIAYGSVPGEPVPAPEPEPTQEPTPTPEPTPTEGGEGGGEEGGEDAEPTPPPAPEPTPPPAPEPTPPPAPVEPTPSEYIEKSFVAKFDNVAPEASGSSEEVGQNDGKTYVGSGSSFTVNAADLGIGVERIELEKFDAESNTWIKSREINNGDSFQITVSGKYRLLSIDRLGNSAIHLFEDLYGTPSDLVYVAPVTAGIDYTVNGAPNTGKIYTDEAKVNVTFSGGVTTRTEIRVNGELVVDRGWDFNGGDRSFTIDLETLNRAVDGKYVIAVETKTIGARPITAEYTVNADFDAPAIANASIEGYYEFHDNKLYVSGNSKLNFDASDVGSGIKSIVVNGANVTVASDGDRRSFVLKNGEDYSIVVTDNAGHVTTRSLTDLGFQSNSVVVDANVPVVEEVVEPIGYTDDENRNWYSKKPVTTWKITDDNLKKVEIVVNGKVNTFEPNAEGVYSVDTSEYALADGNKLGIEVNAYDYANNLTVSNLDMYIDSAAPVELKSVLSGEYQNEESGVYYTSTLDAESEANDGSGVGVKHYELVDFDGKVVQTIEDGKFTVPEGWHSLVAVDHLGNRTTPVPLNELFGTKSNNFVMDDSAPVLTEKTPATPGYVDDSGNKWFAEAPESIWTVEDDNLRVVSITVNGKTKTFSPNESNEYRVDLKDYALEDGNKLTVNVVTSDYAGNTMRENRTLYVDADAPRDVQGNISGAYQDRDFGIYAQNILTLNTVSNDGAGSGTKTYQLVDSEGIVVKEFASGSVELPEGSHSVVVVDNLGNKTSPQTIASLIGLKTNTITYDKLAPYIDVDRSKSNYNNWFGEDIEYDVKFSDDKALYNGTVTVNGKELSSFTVDKIEKERTLTFNTSQATATEDGSYNIVVNATDAAGNPVSWNETIRIDREAPSIQSFTFTAPGFKEGEELTKSDDYGFFFTGATSVDIKIADSTPSSGIKQVDYILRSDNGAEFKTGSVPVTDNTARVEIPSGFKGYIDASATDNTDHTGEVRHPSGVITEDRNWYMNTSDIQIQMPDPGKRDNSNQFLYRDDVFATVPITQGVSGIKSVEWGIGGTTLGEASVGIDGSLSGAGFSIDERNKNLVLKVTGNLPITLNQNDLRVWAKVTDRAGYTSEADKTVSIDKDAPVVDVSYNDSNPTNYYSQNRTATVTITDRNFDPSDVQWSGKYGALGNWENAGNNVWRTSITFAEETEYNWGVTYTDLAGNVGNSYQSETFTVDKTNPQLSVTFDNNAVQNEKYYKGARTATVEIIDRNFDSSKVNYQGSGSLGGWSSNGDRHTASVSFATDGEYSFNVGAIDLAGNASNSFDSESFIIDSTTPALTIDGVENGVSYKKEVGFTVQSNDTFVNTKASYVTLTGRNNGEVQVAGGFNEKTGSFELDSFPMEKKYDDLYTLDAKVVDLAGNESAEKIVFSVNRFGSDFAFQNEDLNGEYFQKLPKDIVMIQNSVDQLDMKGFSVVVLRNGEQIEVPKDVWTVTESGGGDSNWVYTITVSKDFFVEDGAYQVQMFSKSLNGDSESSMAQEYAFVIDNTKPVIYISGVEDNTVYKALEKDVTVEVRDLSGVAELAIMVNDVEQTYIEENGVYKFSIPANSKSNSISVEAKDRAGNMERTGVADVFLTSSDVEALWQKSWVKWLAGIAMLAFAFMVALIVNGIFKRRKENEEKQARLDEAQAASSGQLYDSSEGIADVNMDIPVEDAVLDTNAAGTVADTNPSDATGTTEDEHPTQFIDEGSESTDYLDEGDGSTGHLDEGDNGKK